MATRESGGITTDNIQQQTSAASFTLINLSDTLFASRTFSADSYLSITPSLFFFHLPFFFPTCRSTVCQSMYIQTFYVKLFTPAFPFLFVSLQTCPPPLLLRPTVVLFLSVPYMSSALRTVIVNPGIDRSVMKVLIICHMICLALVLFLTEP